MILKLYDEIQNSLKDCLFLNYKHQIAFDIVTRSNIDQRHVSFRLKSKRSCPECKVPFYTKQVATPMADPLFVLEWMACTQPTCTLYTPQLKFSFSSSPGSSSPTYFPTLLTPYLHRHVFEVERICRKFIQSTWEREIDDATSAYIPLELIHIIALYDPFHFTNLIHESPC